MSFCTISWILLLIVGLVYINDAVNCDEKGKFGWKCRFTCNCVDGADCEKQTGYCENGCAAGYYGTGCQFKNEYIYGQSLGRKYMGNIGKTTNEKTCLSWSSKEVQDTNKFLNNNFPDQVIPGPYCRNPLDPKYLAFSSSLWCYTLNEATKYVEFGLCTQIQVKACPDFLFGDECEKECHCSNVTEVCSKSTGYCYQECYAGWMGIGCDKACRFNRFGIDCQHSCGKCQYDSCDHETGRCLKGCMQGYHNEYCSQKCETGMYGINCKEKCGHCQARDCDPETGTCLGGCEAGFMGELCKNECVRGRYGINCKEKCGHCQARDCDPETGTCLGGCEAGFTGDLCKDEISTTLWPVGEQSIPGQSTMTVESRGNNVKMSLSNRVGHIVGGVIGCCVLVAVIVSVACFIIRRKKRSKPSTGKGENAYYLTPIENKDNNGQQAFPKYDNNMRNKKAVIFLPNRTQSSMQDKEDIHTYEYIDEKYVRVAKVEPMVRAPLLPHQPAVSESELTLEQNVREPVLSTYSTVLEPLLNPLPTTQEPVIPSEPKVRKPLLPPKPTVLNPKAPPREDAEGYLQPARTCQVPYSSLAFDKDKLNQEHQYHALQTSEETEETAVHDYL